MEDYTICSQACWLEHFQEQKLYFSTSEQARLCSGDGFSVSLPAHLLLAASKLARNTFIPGLPGQDVYLPSVRGSTLLLLVEILRSGRTSSLGLMEELGYLLKEVQVTMALLEIPGCTALMRDNSRSSRFNKEAEGAKIATSSMLHLSRGELPSSITPVVEVAQMTTISGSLNDNPSSLSAGNENDNLAWIKVKDEQTEAVMPVLENELIDQVKVNVIPIECHVCKKQFMKQTNLSMHIRGVHREALFSCENCDKKFISKRNMKKHVIGSHQEHRISCYYCMRTYGSKVKWGEHVRKNHRSNMISCKMCSKKFIHEDTLKSHVKNCHTGIPFHCSECPATFSKKVGVQAHMKNVHSGVVFVCRQCSSTFSLERNLERHIKTVHKNELDLVVNCDKQFEQNGNGKRNILES